MAAAIPVIMAVAGTALSAYGNQQQGQAVQAQNEYQARQLDQNAGQAQASGQIAALNQNRDTALTVSRARAVAAASGGSVSDPSVVRIMSQIAGEGSYRADVARYNGESQARADTMQASALRFGGQQAVQAGGINAAATVLSGSANAYSMYNKYYGTSSNNTSPVAVQ